MERFQRLKALHEAVKENVEHTNQRHENTLINIFIQVMHSIVKRARAGAHAHTHTHTHTHRGQRQTEQFKCFTVLVLLELNPNPGV